MLLAKKRRLGSENFRVFYLFEQPLQFKWQGLALHMKIFNAWQNSCVYGLPSSLSRKWWIENRPSGLCCINYISTSFRGQNTSRMVIYTGWKRLWSWSDSIISIYCMWCGHKTIAWCDGSWLSTTDFHQGFNDTNNVLNTARMEIHFRKEGEKALMVFHPSVEAAFFCSEEFMKKPLTSLIYVYRPLNRQVFSGARGALNTST